MSKFEIIKEGLVKSKATEELEIDHYLEAVKDNRERLRPLASMVLTVCGMLLSASFVILFFLIKEKAATMQNSVIMLLFVVIVLISSSMGSAIISVYVKNPYGVATMGERLEIQLRIYRRERLFLSICVILLFSGLFLFLITMGIFLKFTV